KSARFEFTVPVTGRYEVRFANAPHENRATNAAISVLHGDGEKALALDERAASPLEHGFVSLGVYRFDAGKPGAVIVSTKGANGLVAVNAIQLLVEKLPK